MTHFPRARAVLALGLVILTQAAFAQEPAPRVSGIGVQGNQKNLRFTPVPAIQEYKVFSAPTALGPYAEDRSGVFSGFGWASPLSAPAGFYVVEAVRMDTNALASANILNRLGYGPTPDELDRIKAMGPQAYINEQLAPETITENLPIDAPMQLLTNASWQYFKATAPIADRDSTNLYVYLNVPGEGYIDDIKLVLGSSAELGANLLANGDFESALSPVWNVSPNHGPSRLDTTVKHSGNASLHIIASQGGTTRDSSIWQAISGLRTATNYTLSFWYLPSTTKLSSLSVRMSGAAVPAGLSAQFNPAAIATRLEFNSALITDLRPWFITHAVRAKRQLLEAQLQFWENHFVTEVSKSVDYMDRYYGDGNQNDLFASGFEYSENKLWREVLMRPQGTFHDLLKVSAESPAMIIYLDTVDSNGAGKNVANENYARELLELFTFGVDNGYDQDDIVVMSRAWTGWTVDYMDPTNQFNPTEKSLRDLYSGNRALTNYAGVWAFKFRSDRHNNTEKIIFPGKTVPDRFGPPYAGRSYELKLPVRPGSSNGGTNGIEDGYTVLRHLANQPFTQEFISVKLCRLFVHDDFQTGYDFTDPNLSPEGKLVHQCMLAWENGSPKGQIRQVLATIFNSELFRGTGSSMQKVKTPFEFVVSAVRALSMDNGDGTYTATTDGNLQAAITRMGSMNLFDRAEPDGYPEAAGPWISAGTLAERIRWIQSYLLPTGARDGGAGDAGGSSCDPAAMLRKKLPAAGLTDAGAVVDYFLGILYPGVGQANLGLYRNAAINFLNTADDGVTPSLFKSLSPTATSATSPYNLRVRGMVAMLMTLPTFQQQ